MPKKKVFVSYDHSEDAHYKRLLQAWDANSNFDFEFDSRGPDTPIDSESGSRIKQSLTIMMKSADYLLVLVGEKTARSKWVNWEIDRATQADVRLRLAGVKLSKFYAAPDKLLNKGCAWATSFDRERIIDALNNASNSY
jgi:hypothetical protein